MRLDLERRKARLLADHDRLLSRKDEIIAFATEHGIGIADCEKGCFVPFTWELKLRNARQCLQMDLEELRQLDLLGVDGFQLRALIADPRRRGKKVVRQLLAEGKDVAWLSVEIWPRHHARIVAELAAEALGGH